MANYLEEHRLGGDMITYKKFFLIFNVGILGALYLTLLARMTYSVTYVTKNGLWWMNPLVPFFDHAIYAVILFSSLVCWLSSFVATWILTKHSRKQRIIGMGYLLFTPVLLMPISYIFIKLYIDIIN